ncbi:MAG: TetR/AcrR family transcriptional regulator [Acidobacteria bacterium]|nr:TetR/AcrR family transcriptional regulator [Acidobacteriota bacterium]
MIAARRPAVVDRRARRMASTRRDLLLAGRTLFSEKGLYESRVEEITERADIGKGTLYRYFRSKEDLILAVVDAGFEDLRLRVAERIAGRDRLGARVEAIARAHVEFFAENADLMRIFHQVRGMLKFNRTEWRPLRGSLRAHLAFLAAELRQAGDSARMGERQIEDLAILIFGSVSGTLSVRIAADPKAEIATGALGVVAALRAMCQGLLALANGRPVRPPGREPAPGTARRRGRWG